MTATECLNTILYEMIMWSYCLRLSRAIEWLCYLCLCNRFVLVGAVVMVGLEMSEFDRWVVALVCSAKEDHKYGL